MTTPEPPRDEETPYIPPPPNERSMLIMRFVFAMLALAAFSGLWLITGALATGWRIAIGVLVSAPFLILPDLLRDKTKAPPGFKPRKWDDEEDER